MLFRYNLGKGLSVSYRIMRVQLRILYKSFFAKERRNDNMCYFVVRKEKNENWLLTD